MNEGIYLKGDKFDLETEKIPQSKIFIVILQFKNKTMRANKTEHFTESQNAVAILAKVLGYPVRVANIDYLLKEAACICSNSVNELSLARPIISQLLKQLKKRRAN